MDFRDDEQDAGRALDPMSILRMFLRRRWLFLAPFIICLSVAAIAISTLTPVYYSNCQLEIKREGTTTRSIPDETSRYRRPRDADAETMISLQTILSSPKFLERVVRELNLHRIPRDGVEDGAPVRFKGPEQEEMEIQRVAHGLGGKIRITNDNTYIFSIGVRHSNPRLAHSIARKVLDCFLEEELASRLRPTTSTRDFLSEQRLVYSQQLQDAEAALTAFQRSLLSESLAGNPITEELLSTASLAVVDLRQQRDMADVAELSDLSTAAGQVLVGELPRITDFNNDPEIARYLGDLVNMEYENLLADIGAHPRDTENQALLGGTRMGLDSRIETIVAERYPRMGTLERSRISRYVYALVYGQVNGAVLQRLSGDIAERRDFMTRQPGQSAQLTRLRQDVERAQEMIQDIDRDITQENLRLAASLSEIGYRIEVRRDPMLPDSPIEPNTARMAMLGFALAVGLGFGLVLLAEILDKSFKSVAQIESLLGLKVIGSLPVVDQGLELPGIHRRRWLIWTVLILLVVAVAAVLMLYVYPRIT